MFSYVVLLVTPLRKGSLKLLSLLAWWTMALTIYRESAESEVDDIEDHDGNK